MILGTAIHHAVADGRCFFEFIKMMSDIARQVDGTQPASLSLDRSLLRALPTPKVTFDHPEYSPVSSDDDNNAPAAPFVVALFELSKDQLRFLKLRCSGDRNPPTAVSTFQAVAAHAWRCACIARGLLPSQETRLHTITDVHGRLKPPLPPRYLGNAAVRISVTTKVEKLISHSIRYGAEHIRRVLNNIGDEYVRSVVDYVEVTGISRLPASGKLLRTDLRIVSWLSLQSYAGDFGWGEPIYVARPHFSGGGHGYLVRSPRKDGGVGLTLALEVDSMERFKQLFYDEINEKAFSKCLRRNPRGSASSL